MSNPILEGMARADRGLDFDLANKLFKYEPGTGVITRKLRTGTKTNVGDVCGSINSRGYVDIKVGRHSFKAHRIAWLLMTGGWPLDTVDHVNRNRADNRWINLRAANRTQQIGNTPNRSSNTTGHRGVRKMRGNYQARIGVTDRETGVSKVKVIGTFKTMGEAISAYTKAARNYYGEFYAEDVAALRAAAEDKQ